jgi:tetratricopeptide (TPR) repeat protein
MEAEKEGRFSDAAGFFTSVVEAYPEDPVALAARGWCRLEAGQYPEAYRDLKSVYDRDESETTVEGDAGATEALMAWGRYDAAFGYAAILLGRDLRTARTAFTRAAFHGFETAEAFNNAGFCCLQEDRGQLGAARDHLREAIRRNDRLGQAYHNLALCDFRSVADAGRPHLGYIRRAMALGPPSEALYLDAVKILSLACARGLDAEGELKQACARAMGAGADPAGVRRIVVRDCPAFERRPWLTSEVRTSAPAGTVAPVGRPGLERVVSPFHGLGELLQGTSPRAFSG